MNRDQCIRAIAELIWQSELEHDQKYELYRFIGAGGYPSTKMFEAIRSGVAKQRTGEAI